MVNIKDKHFSKQDSFQQVVEVLLASIDKQKNMLNYLVWLEKKKLVQLNRSSTSCLDLKIMSQSVSDILDKIDLYQTLINTKLKVASTLSHKQTDSSHCCHPHSHVQSDANNCSHYWGRY